MLRREYLFRRPPLGNSRTECAMCDTKSSRPFSQSVSLSVESQESCFASILSLFQRCRPLAVGWLVVAVVVYALNAVFWGRLLAHVFQELRKGMTPLFAHAYTASTIPVVSGVVGVVASRLNFLPGVIFGRLVSATSCLSSTATRLGSAVAFTKVAASCSCQASALAAAFPARVATFSLSCKLQHCEFAINIPCLVFSVWGQLDRIIRRHSSTLLQLDCDIEPSLVNHNQFGSFHFSRT